MKLIVVAVLAIAALAGCSTEVERLRYDDSGISASRGVVLLRDAPRPGEYQSLGERSYSFYRPGFHEPTISDVWDDLSQRVRAAGGDACLIKYQYVSTWTARSLDVTCEVLKRVSDPKSSVPKREPTSVRVSPTSVGKSQYAVDRLLGDGPCKAYGSATLISSGAGVETYSATCSSGDTAVVRCEFGQCRSLK